MSNNPSAQSTPCVIQMVISTVVHDQADVQSVAAQLRNDAEQASRRAAVVEGLAAAGWVMDKPSFFLDSDEFGDLLLHFRKSIIDPDQLQRELAEQDLSSRDMDGVSLGWNERPNDGSVDPAIPTVDHWEDI